MTPQNGSPVFGTGPLRKGLVVETYNSDGSHRLVKVTGSNEKCGYRASATVLRKVESKK